MKTSTLFCLLTILSVHTQAQDVVFSEDFESGQLDGEWFWTGNDPMLVLGCNSTYGISKESNDLCLPPLADPWNLSLMFHPVDFDPTVEYTLTAAIKVNAPFNSDAMGEIGLGWLATTGGYGFYYGDAHSGQSTWDQVYLAPLSIGPSFPGARFGVALHVNTSAFGAHASFDNIKLLASKSTQTGIGEADLAPDILVGPNPANDRLSVTFTADQRPHTLDLMDAQGNVVLNAGQNSDVVANLDLSGLSSGLYALRIVQGDRTVVRRVVKN